MKPVTICRFIKPWEKEKYEAEGWTVKPMPCHHGAHAMLATREEKQ